MSVYHPQATLVERKNGDLKSSVAMLVEDDRGTSVDKLPIRLSTSSTMNNENTGHTVICSNV